MKRIISVLLVLMFLFPASALADLRRGDRGAEVRPLQQDVYKRQGYSEKASAIRDFFEKLMEEYGFNLNDLWPVSYTHLRRRRRSVFRAAIWCCASAICKTASAC